MQDNVENRTVIFFVDDEIKVLRGLESMLFDHDDRWEMRFFSLPKEALSELKEGGKYILVTDIQMPEMNGVELMKQVREKFPSIYCIALTGEAKKDNLEKTLALADLLLDKPCSEKVLVDALQEAETKVKTNSDLS